MSAHKNVIELNGKLYDATSGKELGASNPSPATAKPVVIKPQTGAVIDGFVKRPKSHTSHLSHPKSVAPKSKTTVHHPASNASRHRVHHAKTLMRKGLKKPSFTSNKSESQHIEPKTSHSPREERAKAIPKSPHISKFGSVLAVPHRVIKKTEPLHVKPAPARTDSKHTENAHVPTHNQIIKEHMLSKAMRDAKEPEVQHHKVRKHRVAKRLGVSPKVIHFGTGALAALLLAGFVAYQNAPNISMRIAANRAGFAATMPRYQPSGFGLKGPIEYGPGQVTLNFKSNSDQRNFHVTQKVSNWSSEALLSNFLLANNKQYQTYQDNGRTIYIYDGSSATWVSGGVWYQVEGNSSLNSDQLIHIADSI